MNPIDEAVQKAMSEFSEKMEEEIRKTLNENKRILSISQPEFVVEGDTITIKSTIEIARCTCSEATEASLQRSNSHQQKYTEWDCPVHKPKRGKEPLDFIK